MAQTHIGRDILLASPFNRQTVIATPEFCKNLQRLSGKSTKYFSSSRLQHQLWIYHVFYSIVFFRHRGNQLLWRLHWPVTEGCGVSQTPAPSLFSESDNALPRKLIHSCGVVLVLSASVTLTQYWSSIGQSFVLTGGGGWLSGLTPLCTTLSPIVKYFCKCTRRYYLIAGIEQLHYLKFEKKYLSINVSCLRVRWIFCYMTIYTQYTKRFDIFYQLNLIAK